MCDGGSCGAVLVNVISETLFVCLHIQSRSTEITNPHLGLGVNEVDTLNLLHCSVNLLTCTRSSAKPSALYSSYILFSICIGQEPFHIKTVS